MTPSAGQIREQVKALLEHGAEAPAVGIHAERQQEWPAELAVNGRRFALRWCDSPLSVRIALHEARRTQADGTVILTPLPERELGADVLARLSRGRLFRIEQWEMVRKAFQATSQDARLGRHGWIAELLIEHMPAGGYPPVPSGTLDAETAWGALLQATVDLETGRPDAEALLRWTGRADALTRFAALSGRARTGIADWLADVTGPAGPLIMGVVSQGAGGNATALGLVAGLLLAEASPPAELAAGVVRLEERYTPGRRLDSVGAKRWAEAAERVVRDIGYDKAQPILDLADQLLSELRVSAFAALSPTLPSGLEARLAGFAGALDRFVADGASQATLAAVESAAGRVREHQLAPIAQGRVERMEMATRLARWIAAPESKLVGFDAWLADYSNSGAFADYARLKLRGGDQIATLSSAYNLLAEKARARQEAANRSFAEALNVWNEAGSATGAAIPVERILDEVVAPLAKDAPLLLIVVDGLSLPVFAELAPDFGKLGWISHRRETGKWLGTGVAALPTVTEVSRASLLSGRLTSGAQSAERSAFAQHPGMLAHARPTAPVLFHKGELGDGFGLSSQVREAVSDRRTRIVGVVYNAIDDQLDGAIQLHLRWTLEDLRNLPALLHEARGAGRVLVLTADHGHVVENGTQQHRAQDGDRWRRPEGALREGEIRIDGGRVLTPSGATSLVAPWSETVRYGAKKNGYHGGVSLQEVVVPLAVFAPSGIMVPGWVPKVPHYPDWWLGGVPAMASPAGVVATAPSVASKANSNQADLFAPEPEASDWIAALVSSATYRTQRTLAGRVAPPDEDIRRLLSALAERGGKLSKAALAQRLNLPAFRVGGFLSGARRILNVDQSDVLVVDETSETVELNRNLLAVQFQIGKG